MTTAKGKPWLAPTLLMLLGSLALLSAIVRVVIVIGQAAQPSLPADAGDAQYVQHAAVAFAHLVPGIAFMVLGPLQMSTALRVRWPRFHKASGYVFVVSTVFVGVSAIWMEQNFIPVGGPPKHVAGMVWGAGMLVAIVVAIVAAIRRRIAAHRAWMIRAYAYGLGVATHRLILIPIAVAVGFENLTPNIIAGGVWLGWLVNTVVAEMVVRRRFPGFA